MSDDTEQYTWALRLLVQSDGGNKPVQVRYANERSQGR